MKAAACGLLVTVWHISQLVKCQVLWTPVYVDSTNQVDMWTVRAKGCSCSFDSTREDCACCVASGGCHCGLAAPNRCGQCGLHQFCTNMCNVTLDARMLMSKSGKSYGQIKSPAMAGPMFCYYRLIPQATQRVEIQLYRLISVGRFNGTSCEGGFVQLVDGDGCDWIPQPSDTQICGGNERFATPVVLFADNGPATLIFQITEQTVRSQFMAYFSFTVNSEKNPIGFRPRGGQRIENSECDWLYQDFSCEDHGSCQLASPGYPGIYSPNRRCKYHITTTSVHTKVRIKFLAFYLPHNHCETDYVSIYQGSTPSSPLLTTLCANKKQELVYSGPNLVLEFSSGPLVPPFDYNGFLAVLDFYDTAVTTELPLGSIFVTADSTAPTNGMWFANPRPLCDAVFTANKTRSGHFDTRLLHWYHNCTVKFIGTQTDTVLISFFNYKLRAPSCQSVIEVFDGSTIVGTKPMARICSPATKYARDRTGKFHRHQTMLSTDHKVTMVLRRFKSISSLSETEYAEGAYVFHNEQLQGTLQPDTICNSDYYGLSSAVKGYVTNPGEAHIFWNIEGSLVCTQRFVPAVNQSISLQVVSLRRRLSSDPQCYTECGDSGCRCVTSVTPLKRIDHLQLVTDYGLPVSCLCGDFQQEWLPVGLRSWSALRVVYNVAQYSWTTKGFRYQIDYRFNTDSACGNHIITQHSGTIESGNLTDTGQLNYFFQQKCTWLLDSNVERQLSIQFVSNQNRPCNAWNLSIHEYSERHTDRTGTLLHAFCPREKHRKYNLPFKLNIVVIKLLAMTRIPPEFRIKWQSQVLKANSRILGMSLGISYHQKMSINIYFTLIVLLLLHVSR